MFNSPHMNATVFVIVQYSSCVLQSLRGRVLCRLTPPMPLSVHWGLQGIQFTCFLALSGWSGAEHPKPGLSGCHLQGEAR